MKIETIYKKLVKNNIKFVLIDGTALIAYGSLRATFDTDIAIRTIDIEKIIRILYKTKSKLVVGTDKNQFPIFAKNLSDALNFANTSKWGFLKFLSDDIEVDFIYQLPFPFMDLYKKSITKKVGNTNIKIASLNHLKILKEDSIKNRNDREKADIDKTDLNFILRKLKSNK